MKKLVRELQAFLEIQRRRTEARLVAQPVALHMVFKGNPGTGKTTVARVLGRIFHVMDVLPKGHLVECERADLVGQYIGHTAQRTREYIQKAMGGVLFIDEAYSLARGGEKDFGKEAIDTLVKAMEDHKDEFVVILAGYRAEMEFFLASNPGLRSRFPIHMEFPDYTCDELLQIAALHVRTAAVPALAGRVPQAAAHSGTPRCRQSLFRQRPFRPQRPGAGHPPPGAAPGGPPGADAVRSHDAGGVGRVGGGHRIGRRGPAAAAGVGPEKMPENCG